MSTLYQEKDLNNVFNVQGWAHSTVESISQFATNEDSFILIKKNKCSYNKFVYSRRITAWCALSASPGLQVRPAQYV